VIVNALQIDDTLRLAPLDPEMVAEACQETGARVWLDLQVAASEAAELEAWLDRLGVRDLSRRLCLEARDRPGFYPLKEEMFLVMPGLADTEVARDVDYLAFLCRENLLLTVHRKSVWSPQQLAALQGADGWLLERSIAGLVSAVMIGLSLESLRRTAELRDAILVLEERMDHDQGQVEPDELMDLRSELLTLGALVSDQLPSLQALSVTDKSFFKLTDTQEYMNCALANLQGVDRSLDWLDGRLGALRSGLDMNAQDKTNRRLNMLTILSAIFNPATLLAGIWGMNFTTMPELGYRFGYPIALGLMLLIGMGMYFFFRRNGWFD
jgi:magnesium transporter